MNEKKYWICWNADKTEGFITDDINDAKSAISGRPHRAMGYPSESTLGSYFYEAYGEDRPIREQAFIRPARI